MNNSYYETLDKNFEEALKLYKEDLSHEKILEFLISGNLVQKQIAVLKLDAINDSNDAQILLSNLTGQDGKIREVVSLRLREFMSNPQMLPYFCNSINYKIFLDAIIDINANICRNVICAIANLKDNIDFCNQFCGALANLTLELIAIVEKFDFREGKYKVNKEAFKLYWCLETIYVFYDKIEFDKLKQIILRSKDVGEYTIREKAAKILTHEFNDADLKLAQAQLKNDTNYYVRRF